MTQRLPTPGGDSGDWGDILNGYLSVSLYSDGTLNPNVVGSSQLQNNAVTNTQLDVPTQTTLAAVAGKYTKPGGGIPASDLASSVQTNLTAASTAVQSVNNKTPSSGNVTLKVADLNDANGASSATNNQVLSYNSGINQWIPATVSSTTVNNATTGNPGIVQLAGDLAGTATAPTVPSASGLRSATTSVSISGATAPISGQALIASNSTTAAWGNIPTPGNANSSTPGLIQLDGDLGGTATTPTIAKLQGTTLSAPTGGTSAFLNASGTWTSPSGSGNMNTSTYDPAGIDQQVVGLSAIQTLTNKSISGSQITSAVANATNATSATTATAANGLNSASTTVVVNSATAPSSGQVLTATSSTAADWATPATGVQTLTPTAVKTSAYTASPGDFIPVDTSGGNVTITLPTTPADKTRIEIKMISTIINSTNGYGNNIVTFNTGGSDVVNKTGTTSGTLELLNQAIMLQYAAPSSIWYVQSDDLPLSAMLSGISHTVSTTYTLTPTDHVIMADATSSAFTITLPTAVGFNGRYTIEAVTTTTNLVTLNTTSSQTIDGSSNTTLGTGASGAYWSSVDLVSDGANWHTA